MNLIAAPTRVLLLRRLQAMPRVGGDSVGSVSRMLLRGTPRAVLKEVDGLMAIYIVWTGFLGLAFAGAGAVFDHFTGRALPTVLVMLSGVVVMFPLAMAGGLVLVLVWHVAIHPKRTLDLDPRSPSRLFSVADGLGYLIATAIPLAAVLGT